MDLNSIFQNIDFSKLLEKWNQKDSNVAPVPAPALNPDTTAAAAPVTQPKSNQELLDQINSMREQRAQLDKIDAARPQPTEFKKKWNDYVGMGLAGLGQAVALRGGGKVMGPSAMDILKNAKEDNAAQNAKILADWQAKRQAVVDKMSNIKTTAEMVGKGLTDQSRIAKDTAAANLATAQAEQVGQLTPYQKQRLDIEQNRLNEANRHNTTMEGIGRDKVTNANGGTVSPEPGLGKKGNEKLDEMRAKFISEKPAVEQYINQTAAALAKGGMIDQLEQSGEIGGGFLGWRNIVTGLDDKSVVKGLYRSRMSPTQRKMDAMLRGAAAQIARANNPTGTVTDADFTAAMKQVMSLGDDPGNVRDFIKQGHDAAQRRYNLLAPNDKSVQNENPNFVIGTVNGVRYKFDPVTKQNLGRAD